MQQGEERDEAGVGVRHKPKFYLSMFAYITRSNSLISHSVRAPAVSRVCFVMNFCICRDTELWAIVDGRIIQSNLVCSGLIQEVVV